MNEEYTLAAIDIGSNAARLLIKHIEVLPSGETRFDKIMFLRYPLRLGDDVFTIGKISNDKKEKMMRMIKGFKQLMRIYNVEEFRACATSAVRDAKNGESVIKKIQKETGIKINILDGKEEANTIYGSHIEQMSRARRTCAYVDVGGGSTEITLIYEGQMISSVSYNIGTIRMLHNTEDANKIAINRLKTELASICTGKGEIDIVGTGGNINKLYRLAEEQNKKEETFTINALANIYKKLKPLTVEQRIEEFGMKKDRADVIIPAAEIFLAVADTLKSKYINVPTLGLADGIIDRMFSKKHPATECVATPKSTTEETTETETKPAVKEKQGLKKPTAAPKKTVKKTLSTVKKQNAKKSK